MTFSNEAYWEKRYADGRDSGAGSKGQVAARKAAFVSELLSDPALDSVIDWGVGDGVVLGQMDLHGAEYTGIDVSETVLARARTLFPQHLFLHLNDYDGLMRDVGLSLDVLFHFPDEREYLHYLVLLFGTARSVVCIHSSDDASGLRAKHVRRRKFTADAAKLFPHWELAYADEGPDAEEKFYVYRRSV